MPKKRKRNPKYYEEEESDEQTNAKDYYKKFYLEAIEKLVECIRERFNQPSYHIYMNLECLILNAAKHEKYDHNLTAVMDTYGTDFDRPLLEAQLLTFSENYSKENEKANVSFSGIVNYFKELSPGLKTYYSEIIAVIELILVIPASNTSPERHFNVLKCIKSYLTSTQTQERLNGLMILTIYKEELMKLDLQDVLNRFVEENDRRKNYFGTYVESDFQT